MGKKSKKLRRKRKRKLLRQAWAKKLSEKKVAQVTKHPPIPVEVAIKPQIDELLEKYIEEESLRLIFASYNHSQCRIPDISKPSQAKALVRKLSLITEYTTKTFASSRLIRDNINNSGPYKPLFDEVPPDTELKEIDFAGTGRIYFYLFRNLFCVVAIQMRHLN